MMGNLGNHLQMALISELCQFTHMITMWVNQSHQHPSASINHPCAHDSQWSIQFIQHVCARYLWWLADASWLFYSVLPTWFTYRYVYIYIYMCTFIFTYFEVSTFVGRWTHFFAISFLNILTHAHTGFAPSNVGETAVANPNSCVVWRVSCFHSTVCHSLSYTPLPETHEMFCHFLRKRKGASPS